jgi:hypothetical protein
MEFILVLIIGGFALLIWFVPFIAIAVSNRTQGGEKLAWLLAMFFVSWFAWIFYLILAPLKTKQPTKY